MNCGGFRSSLLRTRIASGDLLPFNEMALPIRICSNIRGGCFIERRGDSVTSAFRSYRPTPEATSPLSRSTITPSLSPFYETFLSTCYPTFTRPATVWMQYTFISICHTNSMNYILLLHNTRFSSNYYFWDGIFSSVEVIIFRFDRFE